MPPSWEHHMALGICDCRVLGEGYFLERGTPVRGGGAHLVSEEDLSFASCVWVDGLRFGVQGSGFRVQGSGFRVDG